MGSFECCRNCPSSKRYVGCHSNCAEYQEQKKLREEYQEDKKLQWLGEPLIPHSKKSSNYKR